MISAFMFIFVAVASVLAGSRIKPIRDMELDPAARIGLSGIIGMGVLGTLLYFYELCGAIGAVVIIPVALVLFGMIGKQPTKVLPLKFEPKNGLLLGLACAVLLAIPLVGVLTPSTASDWDSLAYHLAVPKIFHLQKAISSISFIHHSNFPAAVDYWFIAGEQYGGQNLSKSFTWLFTAFGCIAIFGYIRSRFTSTAGWISAIAFLSIPMVMWESGTAYIDVANGLFAGFGFVFAAEYIEKSEKGSLWIAAILLSLAAGSKYTGLQAIGIASIVGLIFLEGAEKVSSVKLGALAAAFASPWYIKNWIVVGNPVYPFFYSVLHGKNWDEFQGKIYSEEQHTFGYHGATNLGQSILGLVTSPGRFTNPIPSSGTGFAFVTLGFAVVVGAIIGIVRGLVSRFDKALATMILIQLVAWFALSQQSRYILALVVPMLCFLSRGLEWKPLGKFVIGAVALQAVASLWIYKETILAERLPVLVGGLTKDEFLGGYKLDNGTTVPGIVDFYSPAKYMNEDPSVTKVGLFDEVFGYYLDKPYFWATPGHTTEMGYAEMKTADEFVASLKRLGISHCYYKSRVAKGSEEETLWLKASGVDGTPEPYPADKRAARIEDQRNKWRVLFAEAVAAKKLTLVQRFSATRFLFKVE